MSDEFAAIPQEMPIDPENHEEKSKTWWIFHHLKGLNITDELHDLDNPMFEDATIVSKKHVSEIVSTIMRLDKKHQREIVSMLDPPFNFGEDYQSFIVVRRTGVMSSDFNPPLVIDSTRRAQRIAALLGLVLLAENSYGETCCLIEQLHRREFRIGMIDTDENCFRYQGGGSSSNTICSPERNYNLSRDELRKVISKEPFRALASVLLPQRPPIPRALRKSIEQSAIRLSDALHLASPSARLLGAVTSIEILISNQGDRYDSNLRRLTALLGDPALAQYDGKAVLDARHKYVHKGEEVEGYNLPLSAIGLALSCLLRYAELANFIKDKTTLVEYLDFVSYGQKLSVNWSKSEIGSFNELIKHKQEGHCFKFMKK